MFIPIPKMFIIFTIFDIYYLERNYIYTEICSVKIGVEVKRFVLNEKSNYDKVTLRDYVLTYSVALTHRINLCTRVIIYGYLSASPQLGLRNRVPPPCRGSGGDKNCPILMLQ